MALKSSVSVATYFLPAERLLSHQEITMGITSKAVPTIQAAPLRPASEASSGALEVWGPSCSRSIGSTSAPVPLPVLPQAPFAAQAASKLRYDIRAVPGGFESQMRVAPRHGHRKMRVSSTMARRRPQWRRQFFGDGGDECAIANHRIIAMVLTGTRCHGERRRAAAQARKTHTRVGKGRGTRARRRPTPAGPRRCTAATLSRAGGRRRS
jgi:hypothetical protein